MAIRATASDVRSAIETDPNVLIDPFISIANDLTDTISANDTGSLLSSATLTKIEILLAAHFYQALRDRNYKSKSTGKASATFQGETGKMFFSTDPGQMAIALDATGYLRQISMDQVPVASMDWLGKPVSEQTDYVDRD